MNTLELPQASQEGDVFEFAVAAYRNEIPGFQDARLSSLPRSHHFGHVNAVLDEIEEASAAVYSLKVPFTYYPPFWNDAGHFAPHIDGGLRGMAVHKNSFDGGEVFLAHPTEDVIQGDESKVYTLEGESSKQYKGIGMKGLAHLIHEGKVYKGGLTASGLTVFSEGNMPGLRPAIHHFRRDIAMGYLRIASSVSDADKTAEEVDKATTNFRLGFAQSDFRDMLHDKSNYLDTDGEFGYDSSRKDLLQHPGIYIKGNRVWQIDMQSMNFRERRKARQELDDILDRMEKRLA